MIKHVLYQHTSFFILLQKKLTLKTLWPLFMGWVELSRPLLLKFEYLGIFTSKLAIQYAKLIVRLEVLYQWILLLSFSDSLKCSLLQFGIKDNKISSSAATVILPAAIIKIKHKQWNFKLEVQTCLLVRQNIKRALTISIEIRYQPQQLIKIVAYSFDIWTYFSYSVSTEPSPWKLGLESVPLANVLMKGMHDINLEHSLFRMVKNYLQHWKKWWSNYIKIF